MGGNGMGLQDLLLVRRRKRVFSEGEAGSGAGEAADWESLRGEEVNSLSGPMGHPGQRAQDMAGAPGRDGWGGDGPR